MIKPSELFLEDKLEEHWQASNMHVKRQVPYFGKRIDIVIFDAHSQEIKAIEIKVSDWRKGLRQAYLNKTVCHNSYVAVWHNHSRKAVENSSEFQRLGIGLIIIDANYCPKVVVTAKLEETRGRRPIFQNKFWLAQ